mgnify:CR=1 FL=1|tara:strand:- start:10044 stop:10250 length:207 start_codon:yes stop_codon:yes gene_type:complete
MKNIIINNGRGTVTVSAVHNVTVTETAITIDLVTGFNLTKTRKTTTKAKTNKANKTAKRRGRPAKATS